MGDNISEKNKSSFKLNNFMKGKILGMYGISKEHSEVPSAQENQSKKEKSVAELLPHNEDI